MRHPIEVIEEDLPYQRRAWVIERIGWSLMAAVLVAAVAGVFGRGPLSQAQANLSDGSLTLDYDRVVRFQAPAELRIRLRASPSAGEAVLALSHVYLMAVSVDEIQPPPAQVRRQGEGVAYYFPVEGSAREIEVVFRLKPETIGTLSGTVSAGSRPVQFKQFVLP